MVFSLIATLALFKGKLHARSDLLTALYFVGAMEGAMELALIGAMLVKSGLI